MFSVSKDFAPPLSMIQPFFMIGSVFYFFGVLFLLFIEPSGGHLDFAIVGWVHWFLLGFVMMIIFGAMAQLVPVVIEVGHFSVDMYYVIWPSLLVGTLVMVMGFWWIPEVLAYGGMLVLMSMVVFLFETFATLKKAERITLTVKSVLASNIFLTIAIVIGFFMSLAIGEGMVLDVGKWLSAHAVLVLGGYVTLTVMGLSMILLPMFGLSHGFDWTPVERAFWMMVAAVSTYLFATIIEWGLLGYISLLVMYISVAFYMKQIWTIYQTRARKAHDIYAKSMYVSFISLSVAAILGVLMMLIDSEHIILAAAWFFLMGFVTFVINGHLYKIIPFLVWFEKYSPLVGKEKVPMLDEMLPHKQADYQFWFSTIGMVIAGFGLLFGSESLFHGGVSLFVVGAGFMMSSVKFMLTYGNDK